MAVRLHPNKPKPIRERFERMVDRGDDCHVWTGARDPNGYGRFGTVSRTVELAHRVAWELANGPVPTGLCVLHRCDNPSCVNPAHLFVGTLRDNSRDMVRKGRHPSQVHPDRLARGLRNGAYTHPERRPRGPSHGNWVDGRRSKLQPAGPVITVPQGGKPVSEG